MDTRDGRGVPRLGILCARAVGKKLERFNEDTIPFLCALTRENFLEIASATTSDGKQFLFRVLDYGCRSGRLGRGTVNIAIRELSFKSGSFSSDFCLLSAFEGGRFSEISCSAPCHDLRVPFSSFFFISESPDKKVIIGFFGDIPFKLAEFDSEGAGEICSFCFYNPVHMELVYGNSLNGEMYVFRPENNWRPAFNSTLVRYMRNNNETLQHLRGSLVHAKRKIIDYKSGEVVMKISDHVDRENERFFFGLYRDRIYVYKEFLFIFNAGSVLCKNTNTGKKAVCDIPFFGNEEPLHTETISHCQPIPCPGDSPCVLVYTLSNVYNLTWKKREDDFGDVLYVEPYAEYLFEYVTIYGENNLLFVQDSEMPYLLMNKPRFAFGYIETQKMGTREKKMVKVFGGANDIHILHYSRGFAYVQTGNFINVLSCIKGAIPLCTLYGKNLENLGQPLGCSTRSPWSATPSKNVVYKLGLRNRCKGHFLSPSLRVLQEVQREFLPKKKRSHPDQHPAKPHKRTRQANIKDFF